MILVILLIIKVLFIFSQSCTPKVVKDGLPFNVGDVKKFQGPFKQFTREFQEALKKVSRVFLGSFNLFSWKFHGYLKSVLRVMLGSFQEGFKVTIYFLHTRYLWQCSSSKFKTKYS